MAIITVGDVPESTRDELAARAARSGQPLEDYLRRLLVELAAHPDTEQRRHDEDRLRRAGVQVTADGVVSAPDERG